MKAIVYFANGLKSLVHVSKSYSKGGVHYYEVILNATQSFLDFKAGNAKLFSGDQITSLTYVMD